MPLPENNILFYWTAPNGAPFSVRGFAPNCAFLCARHTKIHSLRARYISRRTRRREICLDFIRGFRAANSVRLLQPQERPLAFLWGCVLYLGRNERMNDKKVHNSGKCVSPLLAEKK